MVEKKEKLPRSWLHCYIRIIYYVPIDLYKEKLATSDQNEWYK